MIIKGLLIFSTKRFAELRKSLHLAANKKVEVLQLQPSHAVYAILTLRRHATHQSSHTLHVFQ